MAMKTPTRALSALTLAALLAACAEKEVILEGERFDVRSPLEASIPLEGEPPPTDQGEPNRSVPISLGGQVALADWTHRGSNPRHLAPHSRLSAQPQLIWAAPIGEGNSRKFRISSTPVAAGGRIFTMDARSTVTATSTGGGTLWQANLTPVRDPGGEASGGGLAFGEGKLFVTSAYGELVALDPASGGILWRQRFTAPVTGAPAVSNGVVYVVARDSSAWAIEADSGRVRWQLPGIPSQDGVTGGAGPALSDRLALFPFASGQLVATLRQGGLEVWQAPVAGKRVGRAYATISDIASDPVVDGGTIFVGNSSGRMIALDAGSGDRIWEAGEGAMGSIAVGGGSVFLVNDEARLVRLDAGTGDVIWSAEMPYFTETKKDKRRKAIYAHYGPVLAGGHVVVASSDGLLRLFDPTNGALVGTAQIPGGAASGPIVVGGVLYVMGANGQLLAFR